MTLLHAVRRDERGQVLVAGVAISFVVLVLIVALLGVAVHTDNATVNDRSRAQGVQSAEAAVAVVIDALTRQVCVPDIGMTTPVSMSVGGKVVGQYRVMVRLPQEAGSTSPALWNPNQTASPGCTSTPPASGDRVITAWGYGPNASSFRKVLRKLEVNVRVAPLTGFRFVCFAGGPSPAGVLTVKNNMTVTGNCYARTVSATYNNLVDNGTLMSPGTITTKNNTTYQGNLWAGGAVTLGNNSTVTGYVTSSASSVHLNQNATVLGNVTAGTTLTLDTNAVVHGVRCPATTGAPGCPTNAPPTLAMPALRCAATDVGCWTSLYPGMVSKTSAEMTTFLALNRSSLSGSYYITDTGTVDFTGGGTITGPLTIVTRGKVQLSRDLTTPLPSIAPPACTPAGGPRSCIVSIVSTSGASDAIRIYAPRFTANTSTLSVLLYATGTIQVDGGANPTSFLGAVYGGDLSIDSNGMTLTQSQDLIDFAPPFVDWTVGSAPGFTVEPIAWREAVPAPPA